MYSKFDLAPMLEAISIHEDTSQCYGNGDIHSMPEHLRDTRPNLNPEFGRRDKSQVNVEHLLGVDSDWDQVCSPA